MLAGCFVRALRREHSAVVSSKRHRVWCEGAFASSLPALTHLTHARPLAPCAPGFNRCYEALCRPLSLLHAQLAGLSPYAHSHHPQGAARTRARLSQAHRTASRCIRVNRWAKTPIACSRPLVRLGDHLMSGARRPGERGVCPYNTPDEYSSMHHLHSTGEASTPPQGACAHVPVHIHSGKQTLIYGGQTIPLCAFYSTRQLSSPNYHYCPRERMRTLVQEMVHLYNVSPHCDML